MRIIEQFVQALLSIIRARKAGNHDEALMHIEKAGRLYLDADFSQLLTYSPTKLLNHFRNHKGELDVERCLICADLIYEIALISDAQQYDGASTRLKILCLHLYTNATANEKRYQTVKYNEKIAALNEALEGKDLSALIFGTQPMGN